MRHDATAARPVALVTGASAGIGKVFCDRLAARGHDLILVARDAARLDALGRELGGRHGISVEFFPADLSRDAEIARLVARVRTAKLAVLVNNAGFGTKGLLAETTPESQAAMLHLHTLAPMQATQAALPGMLERQRGWVINVSSAASFLYSAGNVNYCATKAYLTRLSEGLATELVGSGVRVQALCPGFTRSEFHERMDVDPHEISAKLWMPAESVVDYSLACIERGGPVICVPGFRYRLMVAMLRHMPRRFMDRIARARVERRASPSGRAAP